MRIDREFALGLLNAAQQGGAGEAEVYVRTVRELSAEVKDQEIDALEYSSDFGYSLRVVQDHRLGFSFATDEKEGHAVVEKALEMSRWTEQDEYIAFPDSRSHRTLNVHDATIAVSSRERAVQSALAIERAARDADSRIKKVRKSSASFSEKAVLIVNTAGLEKRYEATSCTAQITVVAEDQGDSQMGWDFDGNRLLSHVDFEGVGRNAALRAVRMLGARKVAPSKADVVLDNAIAGEFLGIFSSLLSSEQVQKGKSLLAGKQGQQVVSRLFSIVDDGTMDYHLGSRPFDDEGVPSEKTYLVKEGVLTRYLYNTYTARKEGVLSTGNALKVGIASLPSVAPTNLFIEPTSPADSKEDLIKFLDKGLYITDAMGLHTANPVSGEFSIGVSGLWVEKGVVLFPVKEAVISGNILDFFSKVRVLGKDFRFYGSIGAPSILLGPVDISG